MVIYMIRPFFIIISICIFFSGCQRFDALNDPDILTALDQQSTQVLSKSERKKVNEIEVQEVFFCTKRWGKIST